VNGTNLVHDVLQRVGAVNGEADEDEVCLRVGERAKPVVLLLAGCIPQCKLDGLTRSLVGWIGDVVLKDSRNVFLQWW
jgi:hypothetical protein